jgi:threonine/homoserine/homoserine lactone efflux protein
VDLALGVLLLATGVLLAASRLHGRRRARSCEGKEKPAKGEGWAQRMLREPRFGLAIVIGAVVGTPGASYIAALHQLVTSDSPDATQAVAVIIFVIIEFLLVIVPYAFLELRPEDTKVKLRHTQDWILSHARQLIAAVIIFAGAYMAISGLVRLS